MLTAPPNPNARPPRPDPIPAERPFHSLSYPDINYTSCAPRCCRRSHLHDPRHPAADTADSNPSPRPRTQGATPATGVRNPNLLSGVPHSRPAVELGDPAGEHHEHRSLPPAIPLRRLFQPPDANQTTTPSNASAPATRTRTTSALTAPTATGRPAAVRDHAERRGREPVLATSTTSPPCAEPYLLCLASHRRSTTASTLTSAPRCSRRP